MELRVPKDAGANACALAARQITAIDLNNILFFQLINIFNLY